MKNAAREIASSEDILYFFLCLLDGAHTTFHDYFVYRYGYR